MHLPGTEVARVMVPRVYAALLMFFGSLFSGWVFLHSSLRMLAKPSTMKKNYRGAEVPTAAGVVFAPTILVAYVVVAVVLSRPFSMSGNRIHSNSSLSAGLETMLILVLGMCLVGLIDDIAGDRSAQGFRGHLSEAVHGRFTTGLFKAVMGFVVALAATANLKVMLFPTTSGGAYGKWILDAALIAVAANFFNLLDLRPGRALKVFFPGLVLVILLTGRYRELTFGGRTLYLPVYLFVVPALSVGAVALLLFPGDLRERFMLGDAGSNVLGAVIGLGLVLGMSFWWRLGVLVLLVILTALSEIISFSRIIEGNRVLNWLDELGRTRREQARGKL